MRRSALSAVEPGKVASAFRFEGDSAVGPDGTRYGIGWLIDQLPWRDSLPGGGMPPHQYIVMDRRPSRRPASCRV